MRAKSKVINGVSVGAAMVFVVALVILHDPLSCAPGDWLVVTRSSLITMDPASGASNFITVVLSNAGPRRVDYALEWLECRNRVASDQLPYAVGLFGGQSGLEAGATSVLKVPIAMRVRDAREYKWCFSLGWSESDPLPWRIGRRCDAVLLKIGEIFDSQWVPPRDRANQPRRARGVAFGSSEEVGRYLLETYGFAKTADAADPATMTSVGGPEPQGGGNYGLRLPTAFDESRESARAAFRRWKGVPWGMGDDLH